MADFTVGFDSSRSGTFCVRMDAVDSDFKVKADDVQLLRVGAELYEGEYIITPGVDAQTLATAQRLMEQDVQVKAIPFYSAGNNSGGNTVYIASELEIDLE